MYWTCIISQNKLTKKLSVAQSLKHVLKNQFLGNFSWPKHLFSLSYAATEGYRETSVSEHILRTDYTLGSDSRRTKVSSSVAGMRLAKHTAECSKVNLFSGKKGR